MTSTQKSVLRSLTWVKPKTAADIARLIACANIGATARCLRSLMQQGKVEQVLLGSRGSWRRYGYRLAASPKAEGAGA